MLAQQEHDQAFRRQQQHNTPPVAPWHVAAQAKAAGTRWDGRGKGSGQRRMERRRLTAEEARARVDWDSVRTRAEEHGEWQEHVRTHIELAHVIAERQSAATEAATVAIERRREREDALTAEVLEEEAISHAKFCEVRARVRQQEQQRAVALAKRQDLIEETTELEAALATSCASGGIQVKRESPYAAATADPYGLVAASCSSDDVVASSAMASRPVKFTKKDEALRDQLRAAMQLEPRREELEPRLSQ